VARQPRRLQRGRPSPPLRRPREHSDADPGQGFNAGFKADPSLRSFLFTLENRHHFPGRRFALKAEKENGAIILIARAVHTFVTLVFTMPATKSTAVTLTNLAAFSRGLDGKTFFTRSERFTVQEIEVFEITD
jgi:hypothetical protein